MYGLWQIFSLAFSLWKSEPTRIEMIMIIIIKFGLRIIQLISSYDYGMCYFLSWSSGDQSLEPECIKPYSTTQI